MKCPLKRDTLGHGNNSRLIEAVCTPQGNEVFSTRLLTSANCILNCSGDFCLLASQKFALANFSGFHMVFFTLRKTFFFLCSRNLFTKFSGHLERFLSFYSLCKEDFFSFYF